jgi:hypothetical protein
LEVQEGLSRDVTEFLNRDFLQSRSTSLELSMKAGAFL